MRADWRTKLIFTAKPAKNTKEESSRSLRLGGEYLNLSVNQFMRVNQRIIFAGNCSGLREAERKFASFGIYLPQRRKGRQDSLVFLGDLRVLAVKFQRGLVVTSFVKFVAEIKARM